MASADPAVTASPSGHVGIANAHWNVTNVDHYPLLYPSESPIEIEANETTPNHDQKILSIHRI